MSGPSPTEKTRVTKKGDKVWHAWYTTDDPSPAQNPKWFTYEEMKTSPLFGPSGNFDPSQYTCAQVDCNRKLDGSTQGKKKYAIHGAHVYTFDQPPNSDPNDCWILATCNTHNPARSKGNNMHYPRKKDAIEYLKNQYGNTSSAPNWTQIHDGMQVGPGFLLVRHTITKNAMDIDGGSLRGDAYDINDIWNNIITNEGEYITPAKASNVKGKGKGKA